MTANPFTDPRLAARYEGWYETAGRQADTQEKALLRKLLAGFPPCGTLLEVGCGTGHFTRWLAKLGAQAVGLDLSGAMLAEATRRQPSLPYVQGDALALPFADGAFDLVAMITSLEFVPNVEMALAEAGRVARQGILLGVLNRHSLLAWQRKRSGVPLWQTARFFTPGEMEELLRRVLGGRLRAMRWRTTLWPLGGVELALPWGGFIGMAARLQ